MTHRGLHDPPRRRPEIAADGSQSGATAVTQTPPVFSHKLLIGPPATHMMPPSTMIDEASLPKPECVQSTSGEDGFDGLIFATAPSAKPTDSESQ
jgi:hypothetical protein